MPGIALFKLFETIDDVDCLNVFSYVTLDDDVTDADYEELLDYLWDTPVGQSELTLVDAIALVQSNQVHVNMLELWSHWDEDILSQRTSSSRVGGGIGEPLPTFNAYGFRSTRPSRRARRGYKRFVGVPETGTTGVGDITNAVLGVFGSTLIPALNEIVTTQAGSTPIDWYPAVLGTPPESLFPGQPRPRYYGTVSEQIAHSNFPVEWEAYPNVRSQVSRK